VNELSRLPETDARRAAQLPGAIDASIQVPMAAIATAAELLRICESLSPICNRQLHSDLAIAALLADAAARASLCNVRVNAALLTDADSRNTLLQQAQSAIEEASRRSQTTERACAL
jgi:methenyltetrahydrofolate cyclohydrolase